MIAIISMRTLLVSRLPLVKKLRLDRFNALSPRYITFELTGARLRASVFNDLLCADLGHEYKHPVDAGSSAGILCHVFLPLA